MKGKIEYFTQLRQGFDNNRLKTKGTTYNSEQTAVAGIDAPAPGSNGKERGHSGRGLQGQWFQDQAAFHPSSDQPD